MVTPVTMFGAAAVNTLPAERTYMNGVPDYSIYTCLSAKNVDAPSWKAIASELLTMMAGGPSLTNPYHSVITSLAGFSMNSAVILNLKLNEVVGAPFLLLAKNHNSSCCSEMVSLKSIKDPG